MKVKEESEKADLKINIQKMKIMASGPITSWQIDGETMEMVTDFILGGSKITADGQCTCLLKFWFSVDLYPGMGLLGPMVLLSLISVLTIW